MPEISQQIGWWDSNPRNT